MRILRQPAPVAQPSQELVAMMGVVPIYDRIDTLIPALEEILVSPVVAAMGEQFVPCVQSEFPYASTCFAHSRHCYRRSDNRRMFVRISEQRCTVAGPVLTPDQQPQHQLDAGLAVPANGRWLSVEPTNQQSAAAPVHPSTKASRQERGEKGTSHRCVAG